MKKEKIEIHGRIINLEYDEKSYFIEHFYDKKNIFIIIKDKIYNTIVKVFYEPISFVVQVNDENAAISHFIVGMINEFGNYVLRDYSDQFFCRALQPVDEFELDNLTLSEIRLSEKSFKVKENGERIFTVGKYLSNQYEKIHNNEKVKKIVGKNIVMVDQVKRGKQNDEIEDTLTYGINPDTKEIVTPIWSKLQNRLINVYTKEDIENIRNNRDSMNLSSCDYSYLNTAETPFVGLGDATMHFEVDRYIELLEKYIEKSDSIYEDKYNRKINEKFVKKFVPNKVKKRID